MIVDFQSSFFKNQEIKASQQVDWLRKTKTSRHFTEFFKDAFKSTIGHLGAWGLQRRPLKCRPGAGATATATRLLPFSPAASPGGLGLLAVGLRAWLPGAFPGIWTLGLSSFLPLGHFTCHCFCSFFPECTADSKSKFSGYSELLRSRGGQ